MASASVFSCSHVTVEWERAGREVAVLASLSACSLPGRPQWFGVQMTSILQFGGLVRRASAWFRKMIDATYAGWHEVSVIVFAAV